jgi:hypothetical protein
LSVIAVGVAFGLSSYCCKLRSRFFSGSIFEGAFKAFSVAGVLFEAGTIFDIIAESLKFGPLDLHIFHVGLQAVSFSVILYGVHIFYKAWAKLGTQ